MSARHGAAGPGEEGEKDACTVFVRNLAFDVTHVELEELFGEVGPVKKAAVVCEKSKIKRKKGRGRYQQEEGAGYGASGSAFAEEEAAEYPEREQQHEHEQEQEQDDPEAGAETGEAEEEAPKSRGFGFVRFAFEEDAKRAVRELGGRELNGRKLKLQIAVKKGVKVTTSRDKKKRGESSGAAAEDQAPMDEEAKNGRNRARVTDDNGREQEQEEEEEEEEETDAYDNTQQNEAADEAEMEQEQDPVQLARQSSHLALVLVGMPADTTRKQLFKKLRKFAGLQALCCEAGSESGAGGAEDAGAAHACAQILREKVRALLPPSADLAFGGADKEQLAVAIYSTRQEVDNAVRRLHDHVFRGGTLAAMRLDRLFVLHAPDGSGNYKNRCRTIVRNLKFHATAEQIAASLATAFGPVRAVDVPTVRVPDGKREVLNRGFAFVTFLLPASANRAVEVDTPVQVCGRPAAVDMCLSKDKWQEQKSQAQQQMPAAADEDEQNGNHDGGADDNGDSEHEAEAEAEPEAEAEAEEKKTGEGERKSKKKLAAERRAAHERNAADVDEGKTVFVMGLPFSATNAELQSAFAPFGRLHYAVVVRDRSTNLSKGTGFVKFHAAEDAARVVAEHGGNRAEVARGVTSVVGDDRRLTVMDRPVTVVMAVAKGRMETVREEQEKSRSAAAGADGGGSTFLKLKKSRGLKDKRNLYLMNEGLVAGLEEVCPPLDLEKRQRAQAEKKSKLRNPLMVVSACRLSVRNLAPSVDDTALRNMFQQAARKGLAEGRVSEQDMRRQVEAHREEAGAVHILAEDTSVPPLSSRPIKSCKIMRDISKTLKPGQSVQPSRGYGFVEFREHAHALAALRVVNNNVSYSQFAKGGAHAKAQRKPSGEVPRVIVEFAVEDVTKLQVKAQREARSQAGLKRAQQQQQQQQNGTAGGTAEDSQSIGEEQKEKRKRKKRRGGSRKRNRDEQSSDASAPQPQPKQPAQSTEDSNGGARKKKRRQSKGQAKSAEVSAPAPALSPSSAAAPAAAASRPRKRGDWTRKATTS